MDAQPDMHLVMLYRRALICQTFPAYKLHELTNTPATELMQAIELLTIARQVQES